jgi:hypothetical protein
LNDLWKYNGTWTWISGSNNGNQIGNYGTKGEKSPDNVPSSRRNSISWTDDDGNFWLFGGLYNGDALYSYLKIDLLNNDISGRFNDLWKFDGEEWVWVSGSNERNQNGVYGQKGVPDSNNIPGARSGYAVSWMDNSGNMWLFGGSGFTADGDGNANV